MRSSCDCKIEMMQLSLAPIASGAAGVVACGLDAIRTQAYCRFRVGLSNNLITCNLDSQLVQRVQQGVLVLLG